VGWIICHVWDSPECPPTRQQINLVLIIRTSPAFLPRASVRDELVGADELFDAEMPDILEERVSTSMPSGRGSPAAAIGVLRLLACGDRNGRSAAHNAPWIMISQAARKQL
jgi:hypothetical protein